MTEKKIVWLQCKRLTRGRKCLLIMGWSNTDPFCKHKHQPPFSRRVLRATSLQKTFLSSAWPCLQKTCSQQGRVVWLRQKVKPISTTMPGPLPHVGAAALSWIDRLRHNNWWLEKEEQFKTAPGTPTRSPLRLAWLKWQWQCCRPRIEDV